MEPLNHDDDETLPNFVKKAPKKGTEKETKSKDQS